MTSSGQLALGTAQLGMTYGINNKIGKPNAQAAVELIRCAFDQGIREFDTAQAYGDSEEILGNALSTLGISDRVQVITKLNTKLSALDAQALLDSIEQSKARLKIPRLWAIMLHDENWLDDWEKGLAKTLEDAVGKGMATHIGVSVYSPQKALDALHKTNVYCIEIPSNILDRRFQQAGIFDKAQEMGKQVYVRSVYLQGLLVMAPSAVPGPMQFAQGVLEKIRQMAQDHGLTVEEMVLGYAAAQWPQAKMVVGAETLEQIKSNVRILQKEFPHGLKEKINAAFAQVDERILNPILWPKGK